jgi:hypothetical protein
MCYRQTVLGQLDPVRMVCQTWQVRGAMLGINIECKLYVIKTFSNVE